MKKKYFALAKDQKDWLDFTKDINNIKDKEIDFLDNNEKINRVKKLDLHGYSLDDANKTVKKFIIESFNTGYKKLLVITGKGLRSKVKHNPYVSEKLSVLRYSVPEYIKNDDNLSNKVNRISQSDLEDGGEGAFYIFLKKNRIIK